MKQVHHVMRMPSALNFLELTTSPADACHGLWEMGSTAGQVGFMFTATNYKSILSLCGFGPVAYYICSKLKVLDWQSCGFKSYKLQFSFPHIQCVIG